MGCRRVDLGAKYVGVVYLREDPDVIDGSGDAKGYGLTCNTRGSMLSVGAKTLYNPCETPSLLHIDSLRPVT